MKIYKTITNLILSLILSFIILTVFSYLYKYEGVNVSNPSGATDYIWKGQQVIINAEEGFNIMTMDENGFNNKSIPDHVDILLMGSSHMEGLQVSQDENVGSVLRDMLAEESIYNIGMSGHDIYRCVNNFSNAIDYYNPDEYVFIETSTIELSDKQMQLVNEGNLEKYVTYNTGLKHYLLDFPLFVNIYDQMDIWITSNNSDSSDFSIEEETSVSDSYMNQLRDFLLIVSNKAKEKNVEAVIVYVPAQYIKSNGLEYVTNEEYLEVFKETCSQLDIGFIDTTLMMDEMFQDKQVIAHGFPNTELGQGHINKYGHAIVANAIYDYVIKEVE